MLQDLLPFLPKQAQTLALVVAISGMLAGTALWLGGARISQSLITLLMVAVGAAGGMLMPRWLGWSIDGMGPAVGGAVVFGVLGYTLHRLWVGMGLGITVGCWAAVACWLAWGESNEWSWPEQDEAASASAFVSQSWQRLPERFRDRLPWTCGIAAVSGVATAVMWPKLAVTMLYSLLGLSMLIITGMTAVESGRPQWLGAIPPQTSIQLGVLMALTLLGMLVQWRSMESKPTEPDPKPPAEGAD